MRFGFYEMGKRAENSENVFHKTRVAAESGLIAGFLCTPFEKMNVRMCTDIIKPPHKSRKYVLACTYIYVTKFLKKSNGF